jgi:hypothetical protein
MGLKQGYNREWALNRELIEKGLNGEETGTGPIGKGAVKKGGLIQESLFEKELIREGVIERELNN